MKYCLFTLFDNTYFEQGTNMLFSFLQNNKWFNGDIIILCDEGKYCGLSNDRRENIKRLYSNIYFDEVNSSKYSDLFNIQIELADNIKWLSCFYKYEIFKYDKYDKILYLDSDIIVSDNINELFDNDIIFGVCQDLIYNTDNYFNGGLYIIDPKFINKYSFDYIYKESCKLDKSFFKYNELTKGHFVEQDILNIIFKDSQYITFLSALDYNCPAVKTIDFNDFSKSKIKHYYGSNKPWIKQFIKNTCDRFYVVDKPNKSILKKIDLNPKEFKNRQIQKLCQNYFMEYYFYLYWKIKEYPYLF